MPGPEIDQKKVHDFAVEYVLALAAKNPKIKKLCSSPEKSGQRTDSRRGLTFSKGAVTKYTKGGESFQVNPKLIERVMTAFNHYIQGDPKLLDDYKTLASHCNGIDFSMPVTVKKIPAGTELSQMQTGVKGAGETRQGNYYSLSKLNFQEDLEVESHLRGIAPTTLIEGEKVGHSDEKHYAADKAETLFRTTQEVEVLETTAEAISDSWSMNAWIDNKPMGVALETSGGGMQVHVNNAENKSIQPVLRDKWEDALDLIQHSGEQLLPKQKEEISDIVNHYAMVLYNRGSFSKDNLATAIDAYILMQDKIGDSKVPLATEAMEVTKAALIIAIQKHNKFDNSPEGEKKAEEILTKMLTERKQTLSAPKSDEPPEPARKQKLS